MPAPTMHLKVLLPSAIFVDADDVARMVVESGDGALGLLPRRLDCAATLVPGILSYTSASQGALCIAVDAGVMLKIGPDVLVSVRRAFRATSLEQLRAAIEQQFRALDAEERKVRSAMAGMEAGFIQRMARYQRG